MTTIRLPEEIEKKIEDIAKNENKSKSEIIKMALKEFLKQYEKKISPYEAGKDLFGKYGSGEENNSKNYKKRIKEIIHDKISH